LSETPADDVCIWVAESEADTVRLGALLAGLLQPGMTVALQGDLGAGKTRLVQAVAESLGVDRRDVSSPTFTLLQEYAGPVPIFHFDTYRLRNAEEFIDLGADEILSAGGLSFVEWADRVRDVLPTDVLRIEIEITGPTERLFRIQGTGPTTRDLVRELCRAQ
jgi:tRNA threonylcarbamoyladenosine biosynthesis protein TsaE